MVKFYLGLLTLVILTGCQNHRNQSIAETQKPIDQSSFPTVSQDNLKNQPNLLSVSDPKAQAFLQGLSKANLAQELDNGGVTNSSGSSAQSLIVGFPVGLLGEQHLFGGVITKVSDKKSNKMGGLKLSDLTPLHVNPYVVRTSETEYAVALAGCISKCAENSDQSILVLIPVVATDIDKGILMLDFAPLGKELNLVDMMDPEGEYTELKPESSNVTKLEYSLSTLVFDVQSHMVPKNAQGQAVTFTVRWYLKLASSFRAGFASRGPTQGVGYFLTERSIAPLIQRIPLSYQIGTQLQTIHYYIKNVPMEHRAAFAAAFDGWNKVFKDTYGKAVYSYEFVEATNPMHALLVPGDVRYFILEWDVDNLASYGGLGPSIANQNTGEIFSANTLIQGPKIIEIYSTWFKTQKLVLSLRQLGRSAEAASLLDKTRENLRQKLASPTSRWKLSLGKDLQFRIPSQMPPYADPLAQRDDFEMVPDGFTFETYMAGYFEDMVAHELGHNLGLRHNFQGNLGSTATELGKVSSSIMEYLGRRFRHLDRIGPYDVMAVQYGYLGKMPQILNAFCTDENVPSVQNPELSAECSRDDATADPFGYFENQIRKAVNLLLMPGSVAAPIWKIEDMQREVETAVNGLGYYASSALATAASWTNFFLNPSRPKVISEVPGFVMGRIQNSVCRTELDAIVAEKPEGQAKVLASANLNSLRVKATQTLRALKLLSADQALCD